MNWFLLIFQTWLARSFSPSLPCNWPRWCGRGSRPSPRTSSCSSSLDLQQPGQEGQGQPTEQRLSRDTQHARAQTYHQLTSCWCRTDLQAPSPFGWTAGLTSCRWTQRQNCPDWSPRNTDPESIRQVMTTRWTDALRTVKRAAVWCNVYSSDALIDLIVLDNRDCMLTWNIELWMMLLRSR